MNTSKRDTIFLLVALLALTSIVCVGSVGEGGGPPEANTSPLTAILSELSGTVQVLKPADGFLSDAFDGQQIVVKDQVLTHADGRARVNLSTGTILRLSPLSTFTLEALDNTEDGAYARLKLEIGKLWIILRGGSIEVDTPSGLASVRGSYLFVWVQPNTGQARITCLEGECSLGNSAGTVDLVAGQSALISNPDTPPETGRMSDEDVDEWLKENPEATEVIPPLTATVAALDGLPPPSEYTPTPTAPDCGPPEGWMIYTVREKDTLESIGAAYRTSILELQRANCLGESTEIFPGQGIFVPNVATTTPTPTNTAIPTNTATPTNTPTITNTPVPPTATFTPLPSNANAVFASPSVTALDVCKRRYKITATDPDGIAAVKVYYSIDGSDPMGGGNVFGLAWVSGDLYKADKLIPTFSNPGPDTVKYRFAIKDNLGNIQYSALASYIDSEDCGAPTNFSGAAGPAGMTIDTFGICSQPYSVTVDDLNGISEAKLAYTVSDGKTTSATQYIILPLITANADGTGGTYGKSLSIDTMSLGFVTPPPNLTITYQFKALDGHGIWTLFPTTFSFTASVHCGP